MPLCILFKTQKQPDFLPESAFGLIFPAVLSVFSVCRFFAVSSFSVVRRISALAVFSVSAFIPMPSSVDFFFRHKPPSFASLLLPKNTVQNVPVPAGNFRSQKGTLTQNRGYSYADILPHGTAKRLKGTRRPDKATILSATRKQV